MAGWVPYLRTGIFVTGISRMTDKVLQDPGSGWPHRPGLLISQEQRWSHPFSWNPGPHPQGYRKTFLLSPSLLTRPTLQPLPMKFCEMTWLALKDPLVFSSASKM